MNHLHGDWILSVVVFYVYSALVQTMPKPRPEERWYGWFYGFMQVLGANIKEAMQFKDGGVLTTRTTTQVSGFGDSKVIEKVEQVKTEPDRQ